MRVSTKGRYGLRLMVELAARDNGRPVLLRSLSEGLGVSPKYLHHLITSLREQGLVRSVRGAGGGFRLGRAPEAINVGEVVRVLEGPFAPVECLEASGRCRRAPDCVTREVWRTLGETIERTLSAITLADLLARLRARRGEALQFEI